MDKDSANHPVHRLLENYMRTNVPGLQYVVVDAQQILYRYAGGWADIQNQREMTGDTTLMAYSMTKTFTAVAILQLVERGRIGLEDKLDDYFPENPYHQHITVRQLLTHTSGIPNPIPLRWAHLAQSAVRFDEPAALATILRQHPNLKFPPGTQFAYSNIGYWLLGQIIERATGKSYGAEMRRNVLTPLGLKTTDMDFEITEPARHAKGYLARWSAMNLLKPLLTDRQFWGAYEGKWLSFKHHYLNGPAFGGLIGTATAFSIFLQDQLHAESALFSQKTKQIFETPQATRAGTPIPMTLGWHIGEMKGHRYLFKEGGGGGFHSEMRLYPQEGIGTVVMANSTEFNATTFLNRFDEAIQKNMASSKRSKR